jgi:hypothetical protein
MWQFSDLQICRPYIFCDLLTKLFFTSRRVSLLGARRGHLAPGVVSHHTNTSLCHPTLFSPRVVFIQISWPLFAFEAVKSYIAFHRIKYFDIGKEILELNQWRSNSEKVFLYLQICWFAVCGMGHQGNLRFTDKSLQIWEFTICGLA